MRVRRSPKRAPAVQEALQTAGVTTKAHAVIPRDAFHDTREQTAANGSLRVPGDLSPELFDDLTKALGAVEDWCRYMRKAINRSRGLT